MITKQVEEKLTELVHREPFIPFIVEMLDGKSVIVSCPPAFDEAGAGFIDSEGALVEFSFTNVRAIRPVAAEPIT
jgi:hypothetical protein